MAGADCTRLKFTAYDAENHVLSGGNYEDEEGKYDFKNVLLKTNN